MKLFLLTLAIALLSACAQVDPNYVAYANIKKAEADAEAARYNAIARIGETGDPGSKSMAVMALALAKGGSAGSTAQAPQASSAMQWAQLLIPSLTQVAGIAANMRVATVQSNNATTLGVSTNESFVGIAGKIQAPGAVTNNTLSGTGVLGAGTYTTTDSHTTDNHTTSPTPIVTPVVQVPPVVVTPGTKICTDVAGVITCQ